MPVRHGQTPARRLPLPESEPLWRAGRGFVVRDLPWTVEKLRVIPPFEFENWAVIALGGIPNKVQVGDMGVDGRFALIRLRDGSQRRPKTYWQQFGLPAALRIFLPLLFPISQRRHGDFGMFRAGVTASCVVTRLDAGLCATKAGEWSAGFISSGNSLVGLHPMAPHGNLHYG
ncbi:MAG TPA: hypothetical protein DCQ92_11555 [Verrucomicrobia subdivision 3 bacterium]|nr:hypothetical protein [Limisphaerales bacterium]